MAKKKSVKETLPASKQLGMSKEPIREEGNGTKSCFTDFSFKAFTISAAGLGLIAREIESNDYIALGTIGVIALLLLVIRIGNYKYASSNRNFAYELHMFRCRDYQSTYENKLEAIGWEEAMFAWRVVQASIYETIYKKTLWTHYPFNLKSDCKYQWWNTRMVSYSKGGAAKYKYHAGTYLMHMQNSLYFLIFCAVGLLLVKLSNIFAASPDSNLFYAYLTLWSMVSRTAPL